MTPVAVGPDGRRAVGPNADAAATVDALDLFLREVGRYPLLTSAQELELAHRIGEGKSS